MTNDDFEIQELEATDLNSGQAGFYVFDRTQTSLDLADLAWNDRGNGPEIKSECDCGVSGPWPTREDAEKFVADEVSQ